MLDRLKFKYFINRERICVRARLFKAHFKIFIKSKRVRIKALLKSTIDNFIFLCKL